MKTYDSIFLQITDPENNTPHCFSLSGAKRNSQQQKEGIQVVHFYTAKLRS